MNDKASELQSRAKAVKAAAIAALRELFKLKGAEVSEDATMLEMLSDAVVTNAIGSGDILHALHYIRILGTNAEHGEKVKRTEVETAERNLKMFESFIDFLKTPNGFWQTPGYLTEAATRRLYIDAYLKEAGWDVLEVENQCIAEKAGIEIEVEGMPNPTGKGFCDYVLFGKDGKPLAVVGAINDVVTTLENVIEVPVGFFDYSDEPTRVTVGNGE